MECCDARGKSARTGKQELDKSPWKLAKQPPTLWQQRGERTEEKVDEEASQSSGRSWNKTVQGSPVALGPLFVRLGD